MKKSLKAFASIVLVVAMILACAACGGKKTEQAAAPAASSQPAATAMPESKSDLDSFKGVQWTYAHTRTEDSRAHKAVVALAEAMEAQTDGKVKINIQGNSALGGYETVAERVTLGDVTMQMADFSKTVDTSLGLATIPYIISTWDEMEKYMHAGKAGCVVTDFSAERLALQNMTLISGYPQYYGSIFSSEEIVGWEDPKSAKNQKMRVPLEKCFEMLATEFGFQPTGMPASEVYTAIQTGVVEGMIGGGTEYYWNQLKDVVKYVLPVNTHPTVYYLYMNTDALAELPAEYQQLFKDLCEEHLWQSGFAKAQEEATLYEDKFREIGVTVYEVTDEIQKKYTDAYRNDVWPVLYKEDTLKLGETGLKIFGEFMDMFGVKY